jgi:hypothetical protein
MKTILSVAMMEMIALSQITAMGEEIAREILRFVQDLEIHALVLSAALVVFASQFLRQEIFSVTLIMMLAPHLIIA